MNKSSYLTYRIEHEIPNYTTNASNYSKRWPVKYQILTYNEELRSQIKALQLRLNKLERKSHANLKVNP